MAKIKIKADEKLFNRFKTVGIKIQTLSAIMQNDMEVEPEEVEEWVKETQKLMNEFNTLQIDVIKHITRSEV